MINYLNTSILTLLTPFLIKSILLAAARDKSIITPLTLGPLSLIVTITDFLFFKSVTRTLVPKASFLCAAVNLFLL